MFRLAMPPEQLNEAIERVLETVRPALRRDGGDVSLASVADGVVTLRLTGACASCAMSALTVRLGLEPAIRSAVPGVRSVVAI
jgi:Fe-S cluster biogenesis protein NfuA